ncbi:hypothetical protein [Mycoplasma suis]|uniref:hypothetical protein n=1 Tax=Mycoplasma suis TaxID=57372 RepID=UPI0002E02AD0|nr:hypothetical protein [Mycoplasma suis]
MNESENLASGIWGIKLGNSEETQITTSTTNSGDSLPKGIACYVSDSSEGQKTVRFDCFEGTYGDQDSE